MTNTPAKPIKSGRPRNADAEGQPFYESELYKLLLVKMPARFVRKSTDSAALDVALLSKELKKTRWTVYRWFTQDRLSQGGARLLIEASGGRLKDKDLIKFVLS